MSKFATQVGKLPFAGRAVVENTALSAICERTSLREKAVKCARSAGFLAVFALMHGVQAKMGLTDFVQDVADMQTAPSILGALELAVSGLYTAANAAVTYTQFEVGARVARNYFRFADAVEAGGGIAAQDYAYTPRTVSPVDIGCTLAGQAIFMAFRDF